MLKLAPTAIVLAVTVLFIAGCKPPVAKDTLSPVQSEGLKVGMTTIQPGPIEDRLVLTGTLAPWEQVVVMSKVAGKLVSTSVKEGQSVAKDEIVALVNQELPGQDFRDYQVKAPASGVVAKLMVDPGAMVSPAVPIASIINMDRLKITASVIESDISRVHLGIRAEIEVPAYPDRDFAGSISNILPIVDPMSHTAKIEIAIPNSSHVLKPGMSGTVRLLLGRHDNALTVPRSALIEKMGEKYVYLFKDGTARKADIQTGYDDGGKVEVTSGIQAGDQIITTDLNVLKDGAKVRPSEQ